MVNIDTSSEFGKRVLQRLQSEQVIWLTTVGADLTPQPRPVWFWWNGDTFLIFSRPNTFKLRHITSHPRVTLHFDGDGKGGDEIVFNGDARIGEEVPPEEAAEYNQKYQQGFTRIGMSAKDFARSYSIAIRVWPTGLRGH